MSSRDVVLRRNTNYYYNHKYVIICSKLMKAVFLTGAGGIENLELREVPGPSIAHPEELLIRLHAASVNPVDYKIRKRGGYSPGRLPHILGCDGAETVGELRGGCLGGGQGATGTQSDRHGYVDVRATWAREMVNASWANDRPGAMLAREVGRRDGEKHKTPPGDARPQKSCGTPGTGNRASAGRSHLSAYPLLFPLRRCCDQLKRCSRRSRAFDSKGQRRQTSVGSVPRVGQESGIVTGPASPFQALAGPAVHDLQHGRNPSCDGGRPPHRGPGTTLDVRGHGPVLVLQDGADYATGVL